MAPSHCRRSHTYAVGSQNNANVYAELVAPVTEEPGNRRGAALRLLQRAEQQHLEPQDRRQVDPDAVNWRCAGRREPASGRRASPRPATPARLFNFGNIRDPLLCPVSQRQRQAEPDLAAERGSGRSLHTSTRPTCRAATRTCSLKSRTTSPRASSWNPSRAGRRPSTTTTSSSRTRSSRRRAYADFQPVLTTRFAPSAAARDLRRRPHRAFLGRPHLRTSPRPLSTRNQVTTDGLRPGDRLHVDAAGCEQAPDQRAVDPYPHL